MTGQIKMDQDKSRQIILTHQDKHVSGQIKMYQDKHMTGQIKKNQDQSGQAYDRTNQDGSRSIKTNHIDISRQIKTQYASCIGTRI